MKVLQAQINIANGIGSVEPRRNRRYRFITGLAASLAMTVGGLVVVGWLLGIRILTTIIPEYATMKPNSAFCFVLAGLSLYLLRRPPSQTGQIHPMYRRLGQLCAVLAAGVGLLTLGEYSFHFNFGIDEAMLRDIWTDASISPPGRMSIATAFGFFMLGCSLFFLGGKRPDDAIASQILALSGLVAAVFAYFGYVYGVQGPYTVSFYTTMGVHTATVFIILCAATLLARPDRGAISTLTSGQSGGQMARLILPTALTLPFFIGWLQLQGAQAGLYGTEFGFALFATSNIILFAILVWASAKLLNARTTESVRSAHRYRFLADAMPQIVWTSKPDGNLDYCNERWFNYTGMTIEQTKDWGWKHVIHPDDLQNCIERWTRAFKTACDYEVEYRFKRATDGAYRWHLGRAFPMRNENGEIVQWVGTSTDIDDQKRARSDLENRVAERSVELAGAKEKLQAVLDAATQMAIIAADTKGLITVFNRGAEQMLGYTAEEIVGKESPALFHLESEIIARGRELSEELGKPVQGFDVFVEKARNGQHDEREWTYVRKDGQTLTVNLVSTASYDTNGTIVGFLAVATDVTARARAERARQEAEDRLGTLARRLGLATQVLRAGIWDWDIRTGLLAWDEKMYEVYGIPKDIQINYQTWADAVVPQDLAAAEGALQSVIGSKSQGSTEYCIRLPNGSLRYIQAAHGAVLDDTGQVVRVIGVNIDATEQKESEEALRLSEARFSNAFEYAAIGMALVSIDGRWLKVNQALSDSMGYSAEEFSGITFQDITHPDDLEASLANLRQLLAGEIRSYKQEKRYFHRDGRVVWILLGVSLLRDKQNKPLYYISQFEDISEIKQAMTRQRELAEEAQAGERAKSDFLAVMSHEIRTPMNGVIGLTGLLLDTGLNTEQRGLAETIRTSGETLLGLLNDILDFSKIEAGQLSFEEIDFDLRKVVEDTLEMMAGQAQANGIELVGGVGPEVPTKVRGDPGRVQQVLTNLIGNAIKFTKSGEVVIKVTVQAETKTELHARFEIKDTGIGIPLQTQARLFQPFVQADSSTSRNFGGTGLGLAICKKLAESMDGTIGVQSIPGKGSTFWVTLRFDRQVAANVQFLSLQKFVGTRVLVVDHNETSRQFLDQQIIAWHLRNGSAGTNEEALAILHQAATEKAPYLVAIIDIQMPDLDGLALVRRINADPTLNETQIILLTPFAKPIPSDALATLEIAASCVKPARQSALFDSIVQVLTRSPNAGEYLQPDRLPKPRAPLLLRKERILVADDNVVNQRVALGNLRKLGYQADVVANGIEVLIALETKQYDIILMDCQMPDLDGYETTREIRRREQGGQQSWVIAMTANVMAGDREKCLAAGMDDYVSKPLRRAELRAALERSGPF